MLENIVGEDIVIEALQALLSDYSYDVVNDVLLWKALEKVLLLCWTNIFLYIITTLLYDSL